MHVAYFLNLLDDPSFREPNGGTLLDNTMVLIGTEVSNPNHDWDDCTFLVAGARAVIKPGVYDYRNASNDVDLHAPARHTRAGPGHSGSVWRAALLQGVPARTGPTCPRFSARSCQLVPRPISSQSP
jgi:hypothetical protein